MNYKLFSALIGILITLIFGTTNVFAQESSDGVVWGYTTPNEQTVPHGVPVDMITFMGVSIVNNDVYIVIATDTDMLVVPLAQWMIEFPNFNISEYVNYGSGGGQTETTLTTESSETNLALGAQPPVDTTGENTGLVCEFQPNTGGADGTWSFKAGTFSGYGLAVDKDSTGANIWNTLRLFDQSISFGSNGGHVWRYQPLGCDRSPEISAFWANVPN